MTTTPDTNAALRERLKSMEDFYINSFPHSPDRKTITDAIAALTPAAVAAEAKKACDNILQVIIADERLSKMTDRELIIEVLGTSAADYRCVTALMNRLMPNWMNTITDDETQNAKPAVETDRPLGTGKGMDPLLDGSCYGKTLATPAVSNAGLEQPEISSRTLVTALVSYMKENGVRECGNEDFHGILLNGGPINDPRVLLAAKVAELEEKLVAVQTDDADRRRMNWLESGGLQQRVRMVTEVLAKGGRKFRAAVDAAMEAAK